MSANKCANCDSFLSCGCQRRAASDGKACCNNCIMGYEAGLKEQKAKDRQGKPDKFYPPRPKNSDPGTPIINSVKYNP